jgi:hypothetical protein
MARPVSASLPTISSVFRASATAVLAMSVAWSTSSRTGQAVRRIGYDSNGTAGFRRRLMDLLDGLNGRIHRPVEIGRIACNAIGGCRKRGHHTDNGLLEVVRDVLHQRLALFAERLLVRQFLSCLLFRTFGKIGTESGHGPGDGADLVTSLGAVDLDIEIALRQHVEAGLQPVHGPRETDGQNDRKRQKGEPDGQNNEADGDHLIQDQAIDLVSDISGQKVLCSSGRAELFHEGLAEGIESKCGTGHHDGGSRQNHGDKPALD